MTEVTSQTAHVVDVSEDGVHVCRVCGYWGTRPPPIPCTTGGDDWLPSEFDLRGPALRPTARPDGRLYRPRKQPEAQMTYWNDEYAAVMVYRTHDHERVRAMAERVWRTELYGPLPEPEFVWTKVVPWDATGYGYDSTITLVDGNSRGAVPTIKYGGDE